MAAIDSHGGDFDGLGECWRVGVCGEEEAEWCEIDVVLLLEKSLCL